jgi:hypothetical protein
LIKIDVEGHEPIILNRIKKIIQNRKPKAIIFEFNEWFTNNKESEIFTILKQLNMVIYYVRPSTLFQPSLKMIPEDFKVPPSNDYIAVEKSNIDWLKKRVKVIS